MHSRHLLKLLGLMLLVATGLLAANASTAQAKYLFLLNSASVSTLNLNLESLDGYWLAENGLKFKCSGGSGTASATLSASKEKVTTSTSGTYTGCEWVGSKFCTINDGGKGLIKTKGSGELIMEGTNYIITATSAEFAVIKTEGEFCTIPPKEVISGTLDLHVENLLGDTQVKLIKPASLSMKLGNSKIKEIAFEAHLRDENPNATFGIHLVELTGCKPIC